jgi:hypothetical protein
MSSHYRLHAVVTGFILILLVCIPGNLLYATEQLMTTGRRRTYLCCQTGTWMQHSLGKKCKEPLRPSQQVPQDCNLFAILFSMKVKLKLSLCLTLRLPRLVGGKCNWIENPQYFLRLTWSDCTNRSCESLFFPLNFFLFEKNSCIYKNGLGNAHAALYSTFL